MTWEYENNDPVLVHYRPITRETLYMTMWHLPGALLSMQHPFCLHRPAFPRPRGARPADPPWAPAAKRDPFGDDKTEAGAGTCRLICYATGDRDADSSSLLFTPSLRRSRAA